MGNRIERTSDLAKAVHVLRQQGMTVSFPMQTAKGEIIFAVGEDFTLTADQILELLEREELHVEGVRRLLEAQGEQAPRGLEVRLPLRLPAGQNASSPGSIVGAVKSDR